MRFRDLGPLELDIAGRQVSPGPPQQRAVLAALLVDAPHPVQVTALLDRIWGEESPATVTKSIQKYVGNLRRVLGPDVITRVGNGYRLQALDDAIDSRRFIALTRQAAGLTDRADRFGVLSEALGLFRGPMLANVDAPFAGIERARLDELRLAAEEDLLHAQLAFDSPAVVAAACERFVAEHPYRERAWQALMIALYRSGRQRDALAAYRRLRRNLVDELGVDPGPELRALERSILNQDSALLSEGPGPRGSTGTFTELRTVTLVSAQPDDAGDPEAFERLMAELADRVADLAGRFGGRSSHDPRTGPLIVLGAPATGDEPRRAAQLALELATAPARPRVAIATGKAMVRSTSEGLDVVGELANRVRLRAALAEPGSVVLDGATAARLSGLADLAAASGGDAVLVRLLRAQPMSTAEFTGRTGELAEILALADDCVSAGKSRLVTIRGEAGIGKTRLVHELRRALADRGSAERWVEAACRPHGDGRYAPIARLLAQVTAPDVPDWVAACVSRLTEPDDTADEMDRVDLFRAWSTYLTSGVGPAVVVVEDLHNADETLPGFVDELLHLAAALPVLVVCTTRPVEAPKAPMGGRRSTLIELTELDDGESARLLTSLAGPELGPARRSAVVERARGNPLFLIELAQVASDGAEPGQLPGSLEEAITARIDLLHQDDRRMLGFVAVAAAPVEIAVTADVVPVSHREAAGCLERLRRFGLLDVELGPQGSRFVVHHPLICETAARLVPRSRLVAWHLGLARRIERSPQTVENLERRAFHLEQVVDLAPDTPGIRRDLGLAQSALGAALTPVDADRSGSALDRALALLDEDSVDHAAARVLAGRCAVDRGEWEAAHRHLTSAVDGYRAAGDRRGEARARIYLAVELWFRGDPGYGDEIAAARQALGHEPSPELARALAFQVSRLAISGQAREGLDLSEEALQLARSHGSAADTVRVLDAIGLARLELGDPTGLDKLEEALALAKRVGLSRMLGTMLNNLAWNTYLVRGPRRALPIFQEGIAFAAGRGQKNAQWWMETSQAEVLIDAGEWDAAVALAQKVIRAADPAASLVLDSAAYVIGMVAVRRGDLDTARTMVSDPTIARIREFGSPDHVAPWLTLRALLELAGGNAGTAVALVDEVVAATADAPTQWLMVVHDAVEVLVAAGAGERAGALVPDTVQALARNELCRRTAAARVGAAAGTETPDSLLALARDWDDYGNPYQGARAREDAARVAARSGRDGERRR